MILTGPIRLRRVFAPLGMALLAVGLVGAAPSVPTQVPFNALKPQVMLKVGRTADWVMVTPNAVWVGSTGPNAVHRIDPGTDRLVASVVLPGEPCAGWQPASAHFGFRCAAISQAWRG